MDHDRKAATHDELSNARSRMMAIGLRFMCEKEHGLSAKEARRRLLEVRQAHDPRKFAASKSLPKTLTKYARAFADVVRLEQLEVSRAKIMKKQASSKKRETLQADEKDKTREKTRIWPWWGWCSCEIVMLSISLGVYASTVYPTISGGDSGELVVSACNLGAAHPPGYPTWTLLASAAVRLPFGNNSAWRANMMSCFFDAAAAAIICLTVRSRCLRKDPRIVAAAGCLAAGLFAFSPTIWLYAVQAEVFALNNFLVASLLCLYDNFERHPSSFTAEFGAFVCGIALTNQHTTIFVVFPVALAVLWRLSRLGFMTPTSFLRLTLAGIVGVLPYAYLPITTFWKTKDGWGDSTTLEGFFTHFFRREYGTFQLTDGNVNDSIYVWYRLGDYVWSAIAEEGLYVAFPLAIVGLLHLFTSREFSTPRFLVPLASFALHFGVISYLANMDTEKPLFRGVFRRFWQQLNVHLFVWCGDGAAALCCRWSSHLCSGKHVVSNRGNPKMRAKHLDQCRESDADESSSASKLIVVGATWTVASLLVVTQCVAHYEARNFSDSWHIQRLGSRVLKSMPQDAILLITGDLHNNAIKYVQECEGERPDVSALSLPLMTYPWWSATQPAHYPNVAIPNVQYHPYLETGYSIAEFLARNVDHSRVFFIGKWYDNDESYANVYGRLTTGFADRVLPKVNVRTGSIEIRSKKDERTKRKIPLEPYKPLRTFREYAKALWRGVPSVGERPPEDRTSYDAESWEHEIREMYFSKFLTLANSLAIGRPDLIPVPTSGASSVLAEETLRLRVAATLYQRVAHWIIPVRRVIVDEWMGRESFLSHLRNAGTVFGQLSVKIEDANERNSATSFMFFFWKWYADECDAIGTPVSSDVKHLLETYWNPYTGSKLSEALFRRATNSSMRRDFLETEGTAFVPYRGG